MKIIFGNRKKQCGFEYLSKHFFDKHDATSYIIYQKEKKERSIEKDRDNQLLF
jgi:hypothetical protein